MDERLEGKGSARKIFSSGGSMIRGDAKMDSNYEGRCGLIMIRPASGQPPAGLSAAWDLASRRDIFGGLSYYQLLMLISNMIFSTLSP
jgi:hypothetical protein